MTKAAARPDLEIVIDDAFERKDMRARSLGRVLLLIVMGIALLGLLAAGFWRGSERAWRVVWR